MNILHCPYRRAIPVEVEYKPLNSKPFKQVSLKLVTDISNEETMQMIHIEDGHHAGQDWIVGKDVLGVYLPDERKRCAMDDHHYARGADGKWRSAP